MTCTEQKSMTDYYSSDIFNDYWGGYVKRTKKLTDVKSVELKVYTPWGDTHLGQVFLANSNKIYEKELLKYTVNVHNISYDSSINAYVFGVSLCYEEFNGYKKIDTLLNMTSNIDNIDQSELESEDTLLLNIEMKDVSNNPLEKRVYIYKNDKLLDVYGHRTPIYNFSYIITENDIDVISKFKAEFNGDEGYNPSVSNEIKLNPSGKTNLIIPLTIGLGVGGLLALILLSRK